MPEQAQRPECGVVSPGEMDGERAEGGRLSLRVAVMIDDLKQSITNGDLHGIERLIAGGSDPEAVDADGGTPLMHAAKIGQVAAARLLLDRNVNPNIRDTKGMTALLVASAMRHLEMVRLLLSRGADINSANEEGNTALMIAARAGAVPIIQTLIAAGAGVNGSNREGITPLMQAARLQQMNLVKLFLDNDSRDGRFPLCVYLDNGADVTAQDNYGRRALHFAKEKGPAPAVLVRMLKAGGSSETAGGGSDKPWWKIW